jgi:hypothetical protein
VPSLAQPVALGDAGAAADAPGGVSRHDATGCGGHSAASRTAAVAEGGVPVGAPLT